ncbi:MAG: hypothetical protein QNJ84_15895 [Alphaproteobacteria bacterium]|nr:hypothetical protein [Alphaproteobacteria bacterium]
MLTHLRATKNFTGKSVSAKANELFLYVETPRQRRRPPIEKAPHAKLLGELAVLMEKAQEIALSGCDDGALPLDHTPRWPPRSHRSPRANDATRSDANRLIEQDC